MTNDPTGDLVAANTDPGDILAVLGYHRPTWQAAALCRGRDDLPWFPERGQSPQPALALCGACDVRAECLATAMADPTLDGVLGGMTAKARTAARRLQQKRNPHATT